MIQIGIIKDAINLIRAERQRQITEEGYTATHDDHHTAHEELIMAAATYEMEPEDRTEIPANWPWDIKTWKPTASEGTSGRIKELCKAGALYMAAKDYMERNEIDIPLKQAVCTKIDRMAELIAGLLIREEAAHG
jgi:hypothetical protein